MHADEAAWRHRRAGGTIVQELFSSIILQDLLEREGRQVGHINHRRVQVVVGGRKVRRDCFLRGQLHGAATLRGGNTH